MKKYKLIINGEKYETKMLTYEGDFAKVDVDGIEYEIEIEIEGKKETRPKHTTKAKPRPTSSAPKDTVSAAPPKAGSVVAPIPGTVLDIKINVGDKVSEKDVVIILEAMKMESEIHAETKGVVKAIHVSKGDSVQENTVLIEIGAE